MGKDGLSSEEVEESRFSGRIMSIQSIRRDELGRRKYTVDGTGYRHWNTTPFPITFKKAK